MNVANAPQFTRGDAVRLARDLYGLALAAESLPSERDQNFLLRDAAGPRFVLKIANRDEALEVLDLQNKLLEFLAARDTGLEFPRLVAARSGLEITPVAGRGRRGLLRPPAHLGGWRLPGRGSASLRRAAALPGRGAGAAGPRARGLRACRRPPRVLLGPAPRVPGMAAPRPAPRAAPPPAPAFRGCLGGGRLGRLPASVIYNDANDYNVLVDPAGARVVSFLDYRRRGPLGHRLRPGHRHRLRHARQAGPHRRGGGGGGRLSPGSAAQRSRDRRALHRWRPRASRASVCYAAGQAAPGARQRIPEHQQPAGLGAARRAGRPCPPIGRAKFSAACADTPPARGRPRRWPNPAAARWVRR